MIKEIKRFVIYLFLSVVGMTSFAATIDDAKALYLKGRYEEALPIFQELYKLPKNAKNASINQWLGVCLYKTGKHEESKKYFEFASGRSVAEAFLYLSKLEFESYNFEEAQSYIDSYAQIYGKQKKELPDDARKYMAATRAAKSMIDHVEKITIIDSIVVDKANFFEHYKISPSIGHFSDTHQLPYEKPDTTSFVFVTENDDKMMWVAKDSTDVTRLMETSKLIDGSWEQYSQADDILNNNGDIAYPFMMPDGATLYYACNGDGSIGGYDIYMSRRNLEDGSYYQPQNMGMPYNSPFDDYLLVIDENTGVGWWATDRNQIPEKLTIYVFIPNDVRENYDTSDENIHMYAKVNSIKDTWQENCDYSEYFKKIASIAEAKETKNKDFTFEVRKGLIYTSYDDAKSSEGKQFLEQYVDAQKEYNENLSQLKAFRSEYKNSTGTEKQNKKRQILALEKSLIKKAEVLKYLKNSVIKAEQRKLNQK